MGIFKLKTSSRFQHANFSEQNTQFNGEKKKKTQTTVNLFI